MAYTHELAGESRKRTIGPGANYADTRVYYDDYGTAEANAPAIGEAHPDKDNVHVHHIDIESFDGIGDTPGKDKVTVYYTWSAAGTGTIGDVGEIEEDIDMSFEVIEPEKDANGTPKPMIGMLKLIPRIVYRLKITLDAVPFRFVAYLAGKVNSETWRGFDPQTLLFIGGTMRRVGNEAWRIEYQFMINTDSPYPGQVETPRGWNNLQDANGDAVDMYEAASFDPLLAE